MILFVFAISLVSYSAAQTPAIPAWVKNVAGFWSDDQITDQEFLSAIQYLMDHGMLQSMPMEIENSVIEEGDVNNEIPPPSEKPGSSVDLDLMTFKVVQLQELASNPSIIQAVIESNVKFTAMDDPHQYIIDKDTEWKNQPKKQNSPLMNALSENSISTILKSKMKISTDEFGDVLFPEIIITNAYGANVAITGRTDDYNQGDEFWWIKAKDRMVQFRDTAWDESANIFSADIVVQIVDSNGNFIGVLNAATPVK